ncbi:hypothetical protein AV530_011475 [Patagioenas fasciata monilis]|uniref:Uncharacterized protein n=1 Tax=Patagioenas fasciata monilis TaxID=372326 RepID=A0A1V4KA13_PATFA|nr:hypothetical protein AV530_011475 [Patagioenas fasciata monilis]
MSPPIAPPPSRLRPLPAHPTALGPAPRDAPAPASLWLRPEAGSAGPMGAAGRAVSQALLGAVCLFCAHRARQRQDRAPCPGSGPVSRIGPWHPGDHTAPESDPVSRIGPRVQDRALASR